MFTVCSIFDIDHPSQKFNELERVSIIKECSSLVTTLSCMATQSTYEEAAFLQNWMIFA
jgi:hypothetical protein